MYYLVERVVRIIISKRNPSQKPTRISLEDTTTTARLISRTIMSDEGLPRVGPLLSRSSTHSMNGFTLKVILGGQLTLSYIAAQTSVLETSEFLHKRQPLSLDKTCACCLFSILASIHLSVFEFPPLLIYQRLKFCTFRPTSQTHLGTRRCASFFSLKFDRFQSIESLCLTEIVSSLICDHPLPLPLSTILKITIEMGMSKSPNPHILVFPANLFPQV